MLTHLSRVSFVCSARASWIAAVKASAGAARSSQRLLSTASHGGLSDAEELFRSQQSQDHSPEAWGAFAEQYDRSFSNKFRRYSAAVLGEIAARQQGDRGAAAPASLQLLDIGCGTGAMFDALVEAHARTSSKRLQESEDAQHLFGRSIDRYFGVDFSEEMVQFCRHRANHRPPPTTLSASFKQMNAEKLDAIEDESFDFATSMFAMIFAADRPAAVRETYRVLKPGGLAACAGWGPVPSVDWIHLSNKAIRRALQSGEPAAEGISIGPFAKAGVPNFLCWSDVDKLHQEFAVAGFAKVDCAPLTLRFELESREKAIEMWTDMALTFPTLHWLLDHLEHSVGSAEQIEAFKSLVANQFADLIGERGAGEPLQSSSGGNDASASSSSPFGFVDGTAHVAYAHK